MCRNVLVRVFTADYCRGKDRIGWSEASGNNEGREEVEPGDQRVYQPARHKPALGRRIQGSSDEGKSGGRLDVPMS